MNNSEIQSWLSTGQTEGNVGCLREFSSTALSEAGHPLVD